jgi:hypothetical protein
LEEHGLFAAFPEEGLPISKVSARFTTTSCYYVPTLVVYLVEIISLTKCLFHFTSGLLDKNEMQKKKKPKDTQFFLFYQRYLI